MTAYPKQARALRLTGQALKVRNDRIDKRDAQLCVNCGVTIWADASRHHRKFKSRGGGDEVSNGILLCGSGTTGCHGWVHANPKLARKLGLAVHRWEDPREVPVDHVLYGVVYLDDLGGWSKMPPFEDGPVAA